MAESDLLVRRDGPAVHIVLNRPTKKNAIRRGMWQALAGLATELAADESTKVVILSGSGGCFSAGADIEEMNTMLAEGQSLEPNYEAVDDALTLFRGLPRPVVAATSGFCMGGGCMLALTADFRIADSSSEFAITPAKLGLTITSEQINDLVTQVGYGRAKEMLYTGRRVGAAEAAQWGLVNRVVEPDALDAAVGELVSDLLSVSQHSVRTFKTVMGEMAAGEGLDRRRAAELYREGFTGADFREGADAFLARRPPKFPSNE